MGRGWGEGATMFPPGVTLTDVVYIFHRLFEIEITFCNHERQKLSKFVQIETLAKGELYILLT